MRGAYYNEIDPYAAEWLRRLTLFGLVAPGDVDDRSIKDVSPDDLRSYHRCHWFAGIGLWDFALAHAGWSWEREVWTGSCPCQPFSGAGPRGGFDDPRHLWPDWFRLIGERRPDTVLGEQVANTDGLAWFDLVSADLEGAGYAVGAADLGAASVGAPHIRQRLWFVAMVDTQSEQAGLPRRAWEPGSSVGALGDSRSPGLPLRQRQTLDPWADADWIRCRDGKYRPVESGTFPLAHGYPARVGKLRAYGNAICPQVAQAFIEAAMECRP